MVALESQSKRATRQIDGLVREREGVSWGRARDLVRRGKVSVAGRVILDPAARVREDDEITIDLAARKPRPPAAALVEDAIVYVDAHVVVVDKPAGIATVPFDPEGMGASIGKKAAAGGRGAGAEPTLDALVARALGRGGKPAPLGVVHRLDKDTSGLLVFTRTWAAKRALLQAFRFHHVHRRYVAIVHGVPRDGTIRSHLVEDRGDGLRGSVEKRRGRKTVLAGEKAQEAITHVEVIERLAGTAAGQPCALVACRLETGRTHQIRIHLAEGGHPVLGERVYAKGARDLVPSPRLMLHAAELGFTHPSDASEDAGEGEREGGAREMRWTRDPPAAFAEMLDFLRR